MLNIKEVESKGSKRKVLLRCDASCFVTVVCVLERKVRDPKDVLKILEDDSLIDKDKVGSGVYYWSFPAVASETVKRKLAAVEADLQKECEREEQLSQRKEAAGAQRVPGDERRSQKAELLHLEAERSRLSGILQQQKDSDPEFLQGPRGTARITTMYEHFETLSSRAHAFRCLAFAELIRDTKVAKEAANRWTDNADSARKYLRNKYNCEPNVIKELFGNELEYID